MTSVADPALAETAPPSHHPRPESLGQLFWGFTRLALMGFGGVLPVAQRELVDRLRWLDTVEFAQLLSVGQVLPGPNVVNLALMVGDRYFGLRGALVALAGMLTAPLVVVLLLAGAYQHWAGVPAVAGALRGMGACSAGLIIAMGFKLMPALARNPLGRPACLLAMLVVMLAMALMHWPLAWVMLGAGGACCALAWWRLAPAKDA